MIFDLLNNSKFQLYLFHLLIVPLIIYFILFKSTKLIYTLSKILGIIVILYHIYKFIQSYKLGFISYVNLIHILIIGPLLLLVGILEKNTPLVINDFLLILIFGSIVVFLNKILKIINVYE